MKSKNTLLALAGILLLALDTGVSFAAKKDFKGLFGSYRREKFTENEARSTDFGVEVMLSTLLPVSPIVKSLEKGGALTNLKYSTFFNAEVGFNLSFAYHWQAFVTGGYYSYDTRRENTVSNQDPANPTFSQFEMTLYPVVLGCRYRFNTSDIVPYVSLSGGVVFAQRRGFYDNAPLSDSQKLTGTVLQAAAGLEFYISPRTGLRLEMSATQLQLPARTYEPGANSLATLFYQGNPLTVRYASGLFVLF